MAVRTIDEYLSKTSELATISPAAVELINKISLPSTTRQEVADLVSKDEVLFTNVFKLVNSPILALKRRPQNLPEAIDVLGTNSIRNLVFGVACKKTFADLSLWYRSVFVAFTTQKLAEKFKLEQDAASDVYIAGLMHAMGELIFKMFYPADYENVIDITGYRERQKQEKEIFSFTGIELSAKIAEQNGLPDSISKILSGHACESYEDDNFTKCNLLLELAIKLSEIDKEEPEYEDIRAIFTNFTELGLFDKFGLKVFDLTITDFNELHEEADAFVKF